MSRRSRSRPRRWPALGVIGLSVDLTLPTLVPAVCRRLRHRSASGGGAARARSTTRTRPRSRRPAGEAGALLGELLAAAGRGADGARRARRRSICRRGRAAERARLGDGGDAARSRRTRPQGDRRPGRESRLRISYRHQLHAFSRAACARRTGPRRPLSDRRAGGGRARDRLHALYRHDPAGRARQRAGHARLCAARRRSRPARRLREQGWITVAALEPGRGWRAEARGSVAAICSKAANPLALELRIGDSPTWRMSR